MILKIKLWQKILIGLISGIIVGVVFGEKAAIFKPIGDIFIRLIKMIIGPLLYVTIVSGMTSLDDKESLSRITFKTATAFLLSTCFAVLIGLASGAILKPGKGLVLSEDIKAGSIAVPEPEPFSVDKFVNEIVPENAIESFATNRTLQIVFFAFFTGFVLNTMGRQKRILRFRFQFVSKILFKMINYIIMLSPYAAFSMTSYTIAKQGLVILQSLGYLISAFLTAVTLQYFVFGILIIVFARVSPMPFYRKSLEYQAMAFSTTSSKATLPTTMKICKDKLGISQMSSSFVLPLGAAINMDGIAIYIGVCTLFLAQAYQIHLHSIDYLIIIITSTVGSMGAAGIPSGAMLMLPVTLSAVNIPLEGVALIVGIDRILDMFRTTISITGDVAVTMAIDASEKTFNEKQYYS